MDSLSSLFGSVPATGEACRAIRIKLSGYTGREITQSELAEVVGTTQSRISEWENAERVAPRIGLLYAMIDRIVFQASRPDVLRPSRETLEALADLAEAVDEGYQPGANPDHLAIMALASKPVVIDFVRSIRSLPASA